MNWDDAGMPKLGDLAGFCEKLVCLTRSGKAVRPWHFDGYRPLQLGVKPLPNLSEAARPQKSIQPVSPQGSGKFRPDGTRNPLLFLGRIAFQEPVHRLEGRDPLLQRLQEFRTFMAQFFGGNFSAFLPKVFPLLDESFQSRVFGHGYSGG
jgi:hypothetical protein